ncbi:MAG: cupin domain-containing protein [Myxococcota bacterium]
MERITFLAALFFLGAEAPEGFTLPGALRSPPSAARLEQLLARFDWYDHPEGMRFVETDRNAYRTHGHWLFRAGARSKFHRVKDSDELWLVHEGRLLVHVIAPDGGLESRVLGLGPGEAATLSVPAGHWQAAELPPGEDYAFGSNVCAPPFTFEDSLEIADGGLTEKYPMHRPLIERLT